MSPGSQMRALTATNAKAKSNTMAAGSSFERRNDTPAPQGLPSCSKQFATVDGHGSAAEDGP
jgi:hypothetical protein